MHHSIRRALAIAILLAVLTPPPLLAQTPEPVTSEFVPSIVQTELGVSRVDGTDLVHVVMRLDIDAGADIPPLNGMSSVVITVQEGQLLVTPADGRATVSVGTGEAVQTEGSVACERSTCVLETDQPVVIGAGNGFSISEGSLDMDVVGDQPVVLLASLLIPESALGGRCWICPGQ